MKQKKNRKTNNPIGIFDSGIGGLSILKSLVQLLPTESILYFADTKNCPYGTKSAAEIIILSEKITQYLISQNCKLIIIACNTATGAAINYLRKKYPINFVGIEPATKPAAISSITKHIGILATEHTFQTEHFINTKNRHASHVTLHMQPGNGLVELVEEGLIHSTKTKKLLNKYLSPLIEQNIDALVLGCTHYPLLLSEIKKILPQHIKIFNPADSVAQQVKNVLITNSLLTDSTEVKATHKFVTTDNIEKFRGLVRLYLSGDYSQKKLDVSQVNLN